MNGVSWFLRYFNFKPITLLSRKSRNTSSAAFKAKTSADHTRLSPSVVVLLAHKVEETDQNACQEGARASSQSCLSALTLQTQQEDTADSPRQ